MGYLTMNKEKMIQIAERNLRKAQMALYNNRERKGITDQEIENLSNNVEYSQKVYDLIVNNNFIS
jgi:hypothetical protein